jgi:hypothetical protein
MSTSTRTTIGVVAALIMTLAVGLAPASANVRIDDDVVPFYARIGAGEVYDDGAWAAIPFYRPPACIPADFNLLDFFDVPRVFGCGPQTVKTSTIWRNGPGVDAAPVMAKSRGLGAVPVWFVSLPELQAAMADGELTIGELAALPSLLVGTASLYTETLQPTQAAQVPLVVFVAQGVLEDGRSFQAQATKSSAAGGLTHMRVAFG